MPSLKPHSSGLDRCRHAGVHEIKHGSFSVHATSVRLGASAWSSTLVISGPPMIRSASVFANSRSASRSVCTRFGNWTGRRGHRKLCLPA
jgi:hypothetical protein